MTNPLRVVAVASSEETRNTLIQQLGRLTEYVQFDGVVLELSDAQQLWQNQKPDLMIIDLTGREVDACLFIEVINFNVEIKTTVFGLHRELDPNTILKAVSSGVKEFIQYPKDTDALETALVKYWNFHQKLSQIQNQATQESKGQVYALFSSKGGNGCSTLTINLAQQLAKVSRKRVALLDIDQTFSNIGAMLNVKAPYALADLAREKANEVDDQLLKKIIVPHETTGLDLVVACKNILDENPMISFELLERVMEFLRQHYAYIVVDLPSHVVDDYHEFFINEANEVILISSMDILSLYKTRQYLDLVKQHMDLSKFKLVVNRYDLKGVVGMSNKNLEEQFRYPIYHRIPNNWVVNIEAMSLGDTVVNLQPQSDVSKSLEELACLLSGMVVESQKAKSPEKTLGFIDRFRRRNPVCQ